MTLKEFFQLVAIIGGLVILLHYGCDPKAEEHRQEVVDWIDDHADSITSSDYNIQGELWDGVVERMRTPVVFSMDGSSKFLTLEEAVKEGARSQSSKFPKLLAGRDRAKENEIRKRMKNGGMDGVLDEVMDGWLIDNLVADFREGKL